MSGAVPTSGTRGDKPASQGSMPGRVGKATRTAELLGRMKAFTLGLESLGKGPFEIGKIPPTKGLVDQYFNDSTGEGDAGEIDARGPWNEGNGWQIVEAPAFNGLRAKAK